MADILGLANYVQQQGAIGKEAGQKSRLAKLYSQALAAPEDQRASYLPQMAAESPDAANAASGQFSTMRKQAYDDLGQEAGMFVALAQSGDEATTQQAYQRLAAKAQAVGHPVPPQYDPKMLPMIEKLAGTIGGGGSAVGVQSTYIDAQGNRVAIMRDGRSQVIGQNAPNNQIIDTGNGFYGVNKGNLSAAPVVVGGQQRAPQQMAPGEVPFSIDPSLPPEVQASIRSNEPAYAAAPDGAQVNIPPQGQQLRSAPKPEAAPAPETFSQPQTAMIGGKPTLVQFGNRGTVRPVSGAQPVPTPATGAPDAKAQKIAAARADALDSVTQAISGIDGLMGSGGFDNLGTFTGDIAGMIPHTQTKDAQNALETVKNQVLLTTLGKLKALSATGASGFGALSNQEGKILQNSIANLETAQSHAAIVHNLKIIRGTLQRAAGLIGGNGAQAPQTAPQGGHVDDLLSKYGVK